jgi:hypothetical protein
MGNKVHRLPGTELRLIRGHYYLYAVTSKYDPTLKRHSRQAKAKVVDLE